MKDGFNAATRDQEISAGPNARVFVMDQITDVTDKMLAATSPDQDGLARQKALENAQKALIAGCESEPGFRCTLYSFFGGQTYRLFRQIEIKDVRLVYAPPGAIGNYGGEVDNWMWPRHTGDFTLLPRLRRQGRQAGGVLARQRAVQAQAPPAHGHRRPRGG